MLSIRNTAATAASLLAFLAAVDAQVSLQQYTLEGCYSTAAPMYTNSSLTWQYQTPGWCQENCGKYAEKPAFALTKGSDCWCGDKFPPLSKKVDDDQCNRPCQGFGSLMCGGMTTFSVYNSGLTSTVESASDSEASSAQTTGSGSKATATAPVVQSTVTQAGQTIVVTASAAPASSSSSKADSGSGGPSKAGIAAGVVVGIVVIAAIIGAVVFFLRQKKRREIEEDHQRQQTINSFSRGGSIGKSEHSSTDTRLDPTMMYRRQSDGSIADERDLSRRVLMVTNPDRNTMIA